jgi:hypothetical protein
LLSQLPKKHLQHPIQINPRPSLNSTNLLLAKMMNLRFKSSKVAPGSGVTNVLAAFGTAPILLPNIKKEEDVTKGTNLHPILLLLLPPLSLLLKPILQKQLLQHLKLILPTTTTTNWILCNAETNCYACSQLTYSTESHNITSIQV